MKQFKNLNNLEQRGFRALLVEKGWTAGNIVNREGSDMAAEFNWSKDGICVLEDDLYIQSEYYEIIKK